MCGAAPLLAQLALGGEIGDGAGCLSRLVRGCPLVVVLEVSGVELRSQFLSQEDTTFVGSGLRSSGAWMLDVLIAIGKTPPVCFDNTCYF